MSIPWQTLHRLEMNEEYPAAIEALEAALRAAPDSEELIIRLGFNLWYAVAEQARFDAPLPAELYAKR